ncbi:Zinc transporter 6 [Nymphaea thermarum]|nr:Zinc transporter 6 [Nymphaea thermarum]
MSCPGEASPREQCRDSHGVFDLKLAAITVIFITSVIGISSPVLLARRFNGKPTYSKILLLIKCFAAGVILSTSLVHVLPDAFDALADCSVSTHHPWKDFPFAGLVTVIGALITLLVDIMATAHSHRPRNQYIPLKEETRSPPQKLPELELGGSVGPCCHEQQQQHQQVDEFTQLKQRLVSQVLEIGIIFHSVIIGVTMGMSQNRCTIKPLVAALAFHQIFEGMGLGGCIAQAGFGVVTTTYMSMLFSVTTPIGIVVGMIIFWLTGYDDSSPKALIMEGLLGSFSSGILIYMALVDLVAVDFFHNKSMSSTPWMSKAAYVALVLGSATMSLLALWA